MVQAVFLREGGKRHVWRVLFLSLLAMLLLALRVFAFMTPTVASNTHQAPSLPGHAAQWHPTGKQWKLTVSFVTMGEGFHGSRQGQVEDSLMTFLADGRLTATFPASSPGAPPLLPPAIDGMWFMTGPNAFHYQFKDPIVAGGTMIAYIQVQINASLLSPTAFVAGGIGIAYSVATGLPIAGQYNITSTVATAG